MSCTPNRAAAVIGFCAGCSALLLGLPLAGALAVGAIAFLSGLLWLPSWRDTQARLQLGAALGSGLLIALALFYVQERADDRQARASDKTALALTLSSQRDLTGIDLEGRDASRAYLVGKVLNRARLDRTNLTDAALDDSTVSDVEARDLTMVSAQLNGALLKRLRLQNSHLQRARFESATLDDVTIENSRIDDATFTCASIRDTALVDDSAVRAVLSGASGSGLHMDGSDFAYALFSNSQLDQATAVGTSFRGARMNGGAGAGAIEFGPDLRGADLAGADLRGANLSGEVLHLSDHLGALRAMATPSYVSLPPWALSRIAPLVDLREWAKVNYGWPLSRARRGAPESPRGACDGSPEERYGNARFDALVYTGADLRGAWLYGALLEGANLRGVLADDQTYWPDEWADPAKRDAAGIVEVAAPRERQLLTSVRALRRTQDGAGAIVRIQWRKTPPGPGGKDLRGDLHWAIYTQCGRSYSSLSLPSLRLTVGSLPALASLAGAGGDDFSDVFAEHPAALGVRAQVAPECNGKVVTISAQMFETTHPDRRFALRPGDSPGGITAMLAPTVRE